MNSIQVHQTFYGDVLLSCCGQFCILYEIITVFKTKKKCIFVDLVSKSINYESEHESTKRSANQKTNALSKSVSRSKVEILLFCSKSVKSWIIVNTLLEMSPLFGDRHCLKISFNLLSKEK